MTNISKKKEILQNQTEKLELILKMLEFRDPHIYGHFFRVSRISVIIAEALGINNPFELETIKDGALFHDIGKVFIPDRILLKEGALTPEEYKLMRKHLDFGVEIIHTFINDPGVKQIVAQHHEAYDGSGYPSGAYGNDICIGARICSVVDSFDAIYHGRIYCAPKSLEESISEINKCSGKQYDPEVVAAFNDCVSAIDKELYSRH